MRPDAAPRGGETVVAEPTWVWVLVWTACPLLGAGAGWLTKAVAGWVGSLSWTPFQGPLDFVASIPEPWATVGALVLGALAGLVFAGLGARERLTVTVSGERVSLERGGVTRGVERASVSVVFLDGKRLVLLGSTTEELARESSDLAGGQLRDAFVGHGYPWQADGDPYEGEYRRWVEDTPDLPPSANALLKARERALGKSDSDDVRELRAELAKLGVVVRDDKKRQYWRRTKQLRP